MRFQGESCFNESYATVGEKTTILTNANKGKSVQGEYITTQRNRTSQASKSLDN